MNLDLTLIGILLEEVRGPWWLILILIIFSGGLALIKRRN
jgi:hypothetical protein